MMETSPSIAALCEALSKAQGEFKPALKNKTNPHLKNKYADLGSIIDASRAALAANGLSVLQMPVDSGAQGVTLVTQLGHVSGEYIRSAYTMPTTKQDAQGLGSALTYARRYALSALLGIAADEDDDGNAASNRQQQRQPPATPAMQDKKSDLTKALIDATARVNSMANRVGQVAPFEEVERVRQRSDNATTLAELAEIYEALKALGKRYAQPKPAPVQEVKSDPAPEPTAPWEESPTADVMATQAQVEKLGVLGSSAGATHTDQRAKLWGYLLDMPDAVPTKSLTEQQAAVLIDTMTGWGPDERAQAWTEAQARKRGSLL